MLVAQITDFHAGNILEVEGQVVDTLESVQRAVAHLNTLQPRPDMAVVTGDLVAEEQPGQYQAVAEVLANLEIPTYVIPGNQMTVCSCAKLLVRSAICPKMGSFSTTLSSAPSLDW